jgi:hypothetical protein
LRASVNGVPGITPNIGTASQPSNNEADVLTMLGQRNLSSIIIVHGVFHAPHNLTGIKFTGNKLIQTFGFGPPENILDIQGFNISNSSFEGITIEDTIGGGRIQYCGSIVNCEISVDTLEYCSHIQNSQLTVYVSMEFCAFINNCNINAQIAMVNCWQFVNCWIDSFGVSQCQTFINCEIIFNDLTTNCNNFIDCQIESLGDLQECYSFSNCGFRGQFAPLVFNYPVLPWPTYINGSGDVITITDLTDPAGVINISGDFTLNIAVSCVGGTINVYGHIRLNNASGGTVVNDYTILGAVGGAVVDLAVPAPDSVANILNRDVDGNKTDAAVTAVGLTASEIAYLKGILNLLNADLVLTETSGTLLADGTEQNVIINNAPVAEFKPLAIDLDTTNMAAGDNVVIKFYKRIISGGGMVLFDTIIYNGVQAVPGKTLAITPNRYGFAYTLQQTAGVNRNYNYGYHSEV